MIEAQISDLDNIYKMDQTFYKDSFFTKDDIKNTIIGKKTKKSNTIYMSKDNTAFLMLFQMPNKSMYITALAGTKDGRYELLESVLNKYKKIRIYTHGKPMWDMKVFEKCGFKKIGRGNIKDEIINFKEDLTKLWTYEIYV